MLRLRSTITAPDEECIAHGAKYYCQIDRGWRGRSGRISDEQEVVRWRYGVRRHPSGRGWANPFNKADFVVEGADGQMETVIRRASFVPPVFHIMDRDRVIGRIRMISPLRNKYTIDINGVNSWTFRMPLFTILFHGDSNNSSNKTEIWVAVGPSEMEWSILIRPGINDRHLISALAFIHNERWHYA